MTTTLTFPSPTRPDAQPSATPDERCLNALTIDVEDYFHVSGFASVIRPQDWGGHETRVEASTDRVLACMAEAGVRATFFVLGWVAERFPALVRRIQRAGHEIASHGYAHQLIYEQTPAEFRADLRRSLAVLQDLCGQAVTAYRAPSFSITNRSLWALDVLVEEGIRVDSSIYPTHHDRYGIAGTPLEPHRIRRASGGLWEFPPPVCRTLGYPVPVGGGGYFRLYPYPLTRIGLQRINRAGRPFTTYLHPWEFDPEQPRIRAGRLRSFRHYVNLRRTESRLVRLMRDFSFGTMSESLAAFAPDFAGQPPTPVLRRAA